jgi:tripartite-type tricarboxylate transporter receptor subunit TctC
MEKSGRRCRHPAELAPRAARALLVGLGLAAAAALPAGGHAQGYPQRPVRIVASVAPGSGPDVIARLFAHKYSERFGQSFIVENRPGAGGNIGAETVAKAPPDGHTLLLSSAPQAIAATLFPKLAYDLVRDFAPVSFIASTPFLVVVHPSMPVRSLQELIALARKHPGELLFGSGGVGTPPHLAAQMLKSAAKIEFVHVPYRSIMPAANDLVAGQIHFSIVVVPVALPLVRSGRLRALAVTTARRTALAPDLPAVAETIPGYEVIGWYGLLAPAKTPREIVERLHRETQAVLAQPDVVERLAALGTEPRPSTPESFAAFIRAEIEKWGRAVKESGARVE